MSAYVIRSEIFVFSKRGARGDNEIRGGCRGFDNVTKGDFVFRPVAVNAPHPLVVGGVVAGDVGSVEGGVYVVPSEIVRCPKLTFFLCSLPTQFSP